MSGLVYRNSAFESCHELVYSSYSRQFLRRDARADTRVADTRVALIVGNAKYEHAGVLANAVNDAMAVSSLLKKAGFDVEERDNLGVVEFKRTLRDFARAAAKADI